MQITMSTGRDYRRAGKYEYCLFVGEKVVAREGFYPSNRAAKVAGVKKAAELQAQAATAQPQPRRI